MKITVKNLKRLISEELLREAVDDDANEQGDSLDTQVDRYLSQYEKESKAVQNEGRDFRALMRRFLREAEGDEGEGDDAEATPEEPKKLEADKLDVESFASSVMRLIDNYDSLLEVRSTVAKRAINFLSKTYEPSVVESFRSVLRDDHGVIPGESEQDVRDDSTIAPAADRAGPSPGGAALQRCPFQRSSDLMCFGTGSAFTSSSKNLFMHSFALQCSSTTSPCKRFSMNLRT